MMDRDTQNADLGTLVADMRQKHVEKLAAGVALVIDSSQVLASDADVLTRSWLKHLRDRDGPFRGDEQGRLLPALTPEKVFAEFRMAALSAFPDSPTDADILRNSATPDLVRYLLAALSETTIRDGDGKVKNLAAAFRVCRPGAGSPVGVERYASKILEMGLRALKRAKEAGQTREEALAAAVAAGFEQLRVSSGWDPDPKDSKQKKRDELAHTQIRDLFVKEWWG